MQCTMDIVEYLFIRISSLIFILYLVSGWDAAFSSLSSVSVGKPFHFVCVCLVINTNSLVKILLFV